MDALYLLDKLNHHTNIRLNSWGYKQNQAYWEEGRAHDDFDLWLVAKDAIALHISGQKYEAQNGDVILHRPQIFYTAKNAYGESAFYYCHFTFFLGSNPSFLQTLDLQPVLPGRYVQREAELFAHYASQSEDKGLKNMELVGALTLILSKLLRFNMKRGKEGSKTVSRQTLGQLEPVLRYISQNLHKNPRVEELATHIHLEPHYFCELFKKNMGLSAKKYITQIKMQKARELISQKKLSIKEIAHSLGYESQFSFSRAFKRVFRASPSKIND